MLLKCEEFRKYYTRSIRDINKLLMIAYDQRHEIETNLREIQIN